MARLSRDARLETRDARTKLKQGTEPYWRQIYPGVSIGYYKGPRGGTWFARVYRGDHYEKVKLGWADDHADANGMDVFSYQEAHHKALALATTAAKQERHIPIGPYTIGQCLDDYLEWFKAHRKSYNATSNAMKTHIRPTFDKRRINELTTTELKRWHQKLAVTKAMHKPEATDNHTQRARKATANRLLTVFKAALNHAYNEGRAESDAAWRKVKPFKAVDAPKIRYLDQAECKRLINSCAPDFRAMVRAALLTGCRYGELTALKCNDFNADACVIHIRDSKNGKPRHVPLTDEGRAHFERATAGKLGADPMFTKKDGTPWGESHQARPMRDACTAAKITPAISFHVLRHTYGSFLVSKGVTLQVVAELLGHADTRITMKHYAHLAPSYVASVLRKNLPAFGLESDNVRPMKVAK